MAHEEQLIFSLLEWFNRSLDRSEENDRFVLDLFQLLAQHTSAKQSIVRMGGVKFFPMLRRDLSPRLQEHVDAILKLLLSVDAPARGKVSLSPGRASDYRLTAAHETHPVSEFKLDAAKVQQRCLDRLKTGELPQLSNSADISFEPIHLSQSDEKFLSELYAIMKKSKSQPSLYEKYNWGVEILLGDFGPQIFLQRTSLFEAILNDISDSALHRNFCLSLLLKIAQHLSFAFRKASDSFKFHSSLTLPNNTPDASYTVTTVAELFPTFKSDQQISLPFACHEIFSKLAHVLNDPAYLQSTLAIFHQILPFLKLYAESLSFKFNGEFDKEMYEKCVFYYLAPVIEVVSRISACQLEVHVVSYSVGLLNRFEVDLLVAFLTPSNLTDMPDLTFNLLEVLLENHHSRLAFVLMETCLKDEGLCPLGIWLLCSGNAEISFQAMECLWTSLGKNDGSANNFVANPEVIYHLTFNLGNGVDARSQELAVRLIRALLPVWKSLKSIGAFLPLFQALYTIDEGALINEFIRECSPNLQESDFVAMTLRGLYHKSKLYRESSVSILLEILQNEGQPSLQTSACPADSFVFNARELSKFSELRSIGRPSMDISNIRALLDQLRIVSIDETAMQLVEAFAWIVKTEKTRNDFLSNGGLGEICEFLSRIHQDLCNGQPILNLAVACLRTLRTCVDHCPGLAETLNVQTNLLLTFATYALSVDVSIRYEASRLLCPVLFAEGIVCARKARSEQDLNLDTILYSPDQQIADYSSEQVRNCIPLVPKSWLIRYSFVGPVRKFDGFGRGAVFLHAQDSLFILDSIFESRDKVALHASVAPDEIIAQMCKSQNHEAFLDSLHMFEAVLASEAHTSSGCMDTLIKSLQKFYSVPPASDKDALLMYRLLDVTASIMKYGNLSTESWKILVDSTLQNLLGLIRDGAMHNLDDFLQPTILPFLQSLLENAPLTNLKLLVLNSPLLDILKQACIRCFSEKQSGSYDRGSRISCLRCITRITSIKLILETSHIPVLMDLLAVLIRTLGCLQESFGSHDNFTYQNRYVYRQCAIGLRNISRLAAELQLQGRSSESSGELWLFEGGLDWLSLLLSDDEILLQGVALGIISNLILIKSTYVRLIEKIPDFLEMAFSIALDMESNAKIRREAVSVITNYFSQVSQGDTSTSTAELLSSLKLMLENHLFFDKLTEILESNRFMLGFPSCGTNLLRNLAVVDCHYLHAKLNEHNLWSRILYVLATRKEIEHLLMSELDRHATKSVFAFRLNQFFRLHDFELQSAKSNVLRMVLLVCRKDERYRKELLGSTCFLARFVALVSEDILQAKQQDPVSDCYLTLLEDVGKCLAEFRHELDPSQLSANASILTLISFLDRGLRLDKRDFRPCLEMLFQLLQIIPNPFANMNSDFQLEVGRFCETLMMKCQRSDEDFSFSEDRFVILGILGKVLELTSMKVDSEFYERLLKNQHTRALDLLTIKHVTQRTFVEVLTVFQYCSSFLARHENVSPRSFHDWLVMVISHPCFSINNERNLTWNNSFLRLLLAFYQRSPNFSKLAVQSIKLAAVKSHGEKSKKPSKATSQASVAMLDVVIGYLSASEKRLDLKHANTYSLCLQILSVCCLSSEEVVGYMIKNNVMQRILAITSALVKCRHQIYIEALLHFVIRTSDCEELFSTVSTIVGNGIHADLIHILTVAIGQKKTAGTKHLMKLCLSAIRNLGYSREVKVFFLSNDQFLPSIEFILSQGCFESIEILSSAVSLLWVFLYDHQKTKAAIRKTKIPALIASLADVTQTWYGASDGLPSEMKNCETLVSSVIALLAA